MSEITYEGIVFKEPVYNNCYKARTKTSQALRKNILIRQPCEICGKKADAHHESYDDYLNVRWLCRSHHGMIHRMFRKINPEAYSKENYFKKLISKILNANVNKC